MEGMSPNLELLLILKFGLESGESIKSILETYLKGRTGELPRNIVSLMIARQAGQNLQVISGFGSKMQRQALLSLIQMGLKGETIYPTLCSLETDIRESANLEMERFLALLPTKMLIPLLLFLFPAFLILLFGPIVENILHFK
jgi:hypothetical protein